MNSGDIDNNVDNNMFMHGNDEILNSAIKNEEVLTCVKQFKEQVRRQCSK